MEIPVHMKTEMLQPMSLVKWNKYFAYYNIKHLTGICHNHTGQAVLERSNHTLEEMHTKQKGVTKTLRDRLNSVLLPLHFKC